MPEGGEIAGEVTGHVVGFVHPLDLLPICWTARSQGRADVVIS
jgi:hypothetical protein